MKNKNKKTTSAVAYQGEVKATIKHGNKVLKTTKIKNNGKWPLFLFLAKCAAGEYSEAEKYRPKYIQLYHIEPKTGDITTDYFQDYDWELRSNVTGLSSTTETDYSDIANNENGLTKLKFTIPFSYIINLSQADINFLVLRSDSNLSNATDAGDDQKEVCAYIKLDEDSLIASNLTQSNKYTLIVEWTLQFNNN